MTSSGKPLIPAEDLQQLTMKWLDCLVSAARVGDRKGFGDLFHHQCVVFGGEKGGCVDWDMAYQLEFESKNAKLVTMEIPLAVLCVVNWNSKPLVDMTQAHRGHATFYLAMFRGSEEGRWKMECMHAHFSKINAS